MTTDQKSLARTMKSFAAEQVAHGHPKQANNDERSARHLQMQLDIFAPSQACESHPGLAGGRPSQVSFMGVND